MALLDTVDRSLGLLTLRETRTRLRGWKGFGLVTSIASVYALLSMLIGQMLILVPLTGQYTIEIVWGQAYQWWDYPAVFVEGSWGVLTLPFFPTLAMVLVSIGVGFGAATGIQLLIPLLRRRSTLDARSTTAGAAVGVGPAITGVATLGACCCTSCVGVTGITVVAAASGTDLNTLLLNNWYIGVFQMVVVYVALLAQERILTANKTYCPTPPPLDRKFAAGTILRLTLMIAGITWSLAMFVEWTGISPLSADAPTWYHWIFEHQLLSLTAIAAGLFPREFASLVRSIALRWSGIGWRLALAVGGITWGVWVPSYVAGIGLGGFLNELLGFLGAPSSWGAIPPDAALGPPLYFHWAFQHLLLAAFAIILAVSPTRAVAPLEWTISADRPVALERSPYSSPPVAPGNPQ